MIGHSTVLMEVGGTKILTDPYFGTWGNPAYKRLTPPARKREELRDVDLVLVSHNHWDHTDGSFFRSLRTGTPVVAPRRSAWLTRLRGARTVVGMKAWEERGFGPVKICAVPAHHMATAIGFVIQHEEERVYFAGDTYHGQFMAEIGKRFRLDAALIPVTTYRIPLTMGETGAVRAVGDLDPSVIIPIHLGLRPRSPLLRTGQTPEGFARRAAAAGTGAAVVILLEGQSWTAPEGAASALRQAL
jgi:L-ascorbate metabolism protein UlaG (beta-lactamase superfamily)